jgi:DNA-directed RNA polymerase subunit F
VTELAKGNLTEKKLAIPEVKKLLESIGDENLDQLQRRTLDYASKFSKIESQSAEQLIKRLTTEFGIDEDEAIQIVNCMPKTVDELRVFMAGGRKIIDASMLKTIIGILDEQRKLK